MAVTVAVTYSNNFIILHYILVLMKVTFYRYVHKFSEDNHRKEDAGIFLGNLKEYYFSSSGRIAFYL